MALFKKKKKNEEESPEVDEFGIMDGDDDDVFSSAISPGISYEDDDFEYEDDFDDDDDEEDDPRRSSADTEGVDKKKFFGFIFLILIVLALAAFFVFGSSSGDGGDKPSETSQAQEGDNGENKGIVVQEANGETYNGNDDGNPVNGTGAILAFDYAYYTERSGEKARKYFNPDAIQYDANYIQKAIDSNVPEGTKYDLSITPKSIGKEYDVVLTITEPGTDPYKFNQKFSVMEKEGRFYVEKFTSTPSKENNAS